MPQKKKIHMFVSGRVQGVSFRYHTMVNAQRLDVGGWVRNLPDRRVEIVAYGPSTKVDKLVQWAHSGPRFATVTGVEVVEETENVRYDGQDAFEIRYY